MTYIKKDLFNDPINNYGLDLLTEAILADDIDLVLDALNLGAEIMPDALTIACSIGNAAIVKLLAEYNAEPDDDTIYMAYKSNNKTIIAIIESIMISAP